MDSMSDDDDVSCNLPEDEVLEIKRAMRVAKARKKSLSLQMKSKLDKTSADRSELESILRKQSAELARTKTLLSQTDFDLKEARFEMNQMVEREQRLKEEKKMIETKSNEVIAELKLQLEQQERTREERNQVALFECDKLIKTLASLYKSVFDGRVNNPIAPKTTKQLLDKAANDAEHLREFLKSKAMSLLTEEQEQIYNLQAKSRIIKVDSGCDSALLDMCRSLEEENRALSDTVETLKVQLAEASRDASINRLIPHYRLAIVRSRTYAANLLEQIKREQDTSQTLREQLDATYADLKKVVEEKRKLFTRMSKYSLQLEEQDSYLSHQRAVDEQRILQQTQQAQNQSAPPPQRESAADANFHTHPAQGGTAANRAGLPRANPTTSDSSDVDYGSASVSGASTSATSVSAPLRMQSAYLQEVSNSNSATSSNSAVGSVAGSGSGGASSQRGDAGLTRGEKAAASLYLKEELSQLDNEIDQLKEKLGKAAMLKSQRILSEVLDAHAPMALFGRS